MTKYLCPFKINIKVYNYVHCHSILVASYNLMDVKYFMENFKCLKNYLKILSVKFDVLPGECKLSTKAIHKNMS